MRLKRMITLLLLMLVLTGVVSAAEILQNADCHVTADEVVEGNLLVLCGELIVEGQVEGNLIGAAFTANVSGTVEKGIYLASGQLDVAGDVGGTLHFAGVALNILADADFTQGDVISLGLSTTLRPGASVPGSMIGVGYQMILDGSVGDDVDFAGSALHINGEINGHVDVSVGDAASTGTASSLQTLLIPFPWEVNLVDPGLQISEIASISGDLQYRSPAEGTIQGQIAGDTRYVPVISGPTLEDLVEEESRASALELYFQQVVREFTTLGLIGLIGLLLVPQFMQTHIKAIRRQPFTSLGVGLLTFVLSFPVALLIAILSLLIILLLSFLRLDGVVVASGILLGVFTIGGTSFFYFVAIFISRTVLALALGRVLMSQFSSNNSNTLYGWLLSLVIGVGVLALIASIPGIGWIFNALALFLGLGSILYILQGQLRAFRDRSSGPRTVPVGYGSAAFVVQPDMPPPILDEGSVPYGMDNLPEGFDWWGRDEK